MGDVVEWPWALPNPADDPGHSPVSATAALNEALGRLGEVRVSGRAIGPWRQSSVGPLAALGEGTDRVVVRWAGDADPPPWPAGAEMEAMGRWWVPGGRLVLDTTDAVVLVDLDGGPDQAP
jgi:hypothetical protein